MRTTSADRESTRTSSIDSCAPRSYADADGRVASSDFRKPKKQVHTTTHSMTVLKSTLLASHERLSLRMMSVATPLEKYLFLLAPVSLAARTV